MLKEYKTWIQKKLRECEAWMQTAQSNETITYHEGYLARDRFYDNETRDIANLFMRLAEGNNVVLYQKRIKYGSTNHDPIFKYIAKKI